MRTIEESIQWNIDLGENMQHEWLGSDWFNVSPEEAEVFSITQRQWPRMMAALCAFQVIGEFVEGDTFQFDEEAVEAFRKARPELCERGEQGFVRFATEMVGLSIREAVLAYNKDRFWRVRTGNIIFDDEEMVDADPEDPVKEIRPMK